MIFWYESAVRLAWPFGSPNELGAAMAMLLPYVWACAGGTRRWSFATLGWLSVEGVLFWVLCRTYSRGALLALSIAMLAYAWLSWDSRSRHHRRMVFYEWATRVVLMVCIVWSVGVYRRVSYEYVGADPGVHTRLVLARAALEMVRDSPWIGWGWNRGIYSYMNWYQPLSDHHVYGNFVSGVVQFAVDNGLLALGAATVCVGIILAPTVLAVRGGTAWPTFRFRGLFGVSFAAGLVANCFSCLTSSMLFTSMWVITAVLSACGVWTLAREVQKRVLSLSVIGGMAVPALILIAGGCLSPDVSLLTGRMEDGTVVIRARRAVSQAHVVHTFVDPAVMAGGGGKLIRELAMGAKNATFYVHNRPTDRVLNKGDKLLLMGRSWEVGLRYPDQSKALLHPMLIVGEKWLQNVDIVSLGEADFEFQNGYWIHHYGGTSEILIDPTMGRALAFWPSLLKERLYAWMDN
ncbi:hypothetical protein DB347_18030 [Opitutaceae bacterium EW11]|nr:hypothetical protein DB347_18030 [Opitutaceae bacterium EW11]